MTALLTGAATLFLAIALALVLGLVALLVVFAGVSRTDHLDRRLAAQPDAKAGRLARRTVGLYRRGGPPTPPTLRAA